MTEEDEQQKRMTQVFNNWSDLLKLPTIGPFYAFSHEADPYVQGFQNIIQALIKFKLI